MLKKVIDILRLKKINDFKCIEAVKKLKEKYIIYAANYGDILSKQYFSLKKKFIHIHPGKLPEYKGSTTYYYEILERNSISYSAIFQNLKIDDGKIIYSRTYNLKNTRIKKNEKTYYIIHPVLKHISILSKI